MHPALGRRMTLQVVALSQAGATLRSVDEALQEEPEQGVLLPVGELPQGLRRGDKLEVFIYLDTHDEPIATLQTPRVELGGVALLEAVDSTPFGTFMDWGLPRDLLVPFREQLNPMVLGRRYLVALYQDDTGRLAGTTRLQSVLKPGDYELDVWVTGIAWREEPELGLFVLLEGKHLALLPATEPHGLKMGDSASFRIAHVHLDGKIEVSQRQLAHRHIEPDAQKLLALLQGPKPPRLGDYSDPDQIRALVGISKKAFKRAAGHLLKARLASFDAQGYLVLSTPEQRDAPRTQPPPHRSLSGRSDPPAPPRAVQAPRRGSSSRYEPRAPDRGTPLRGPAERRREYVPGEDDESS